VIAGSARGRVLDTPPGFETRPTLNRVREALFNILAPNLAGAQFLDLFAGSGANGIEALSRGAAHATFAEESGPSLTVLRANLAKVQFADTADVVRCSLPRDARLLKKQDRKFDIVFADPPYDYNQYSALGDSLHEHTLLNQNAIIVIEHHMDSAIGEVIGPYNRSRIAKYGEVRLSFYC
jgi:16S rRNA (guanine966-N2)-methyltransferase